jgi:hypothetical protein
MPSYAFRDGSGNLKYAAVGSGTGTELDPYVLSSAVTSSIASYTHGSASITDAGVTLFAANPNRQAGVIANRSLTESCDVFFSAVGVHGQGLPLAPGASMSVNPLYRGIVTARSATGIVVPVSVALGV